MKRLLVTEHAADKMRARGITLTEVEACVWTPELVYGNVHGEIRQRGLIACGVKAHGQDVILRTVLYRHQDQWTDDDARQRTEQGGTR